MEYDIDAHINQAFIEILEKRCVLRYTDLSNDDGFIPEILKFPIPQLPNSMLKEIKQQIEVGVKFRVPFSDTGFSFSPPKDIILKILETKRISERLRNYYSSYILHNFVIWAVDSQVNKTIENVDFIFKSLLFDHSSYYKGVFTECIFILLQILLDFKPSEEVFDSCFSYISDVFAGFSTLPEYGYTFYPKLLNYLLFDHHNDFPPSVLKVTSLITISLQKHCKEVKTEIKSEIFEILHPFLAQFDLVALSFFSDLCLYISQTETLNYISTIPMLTWSKILSNKAYFEAPVSTGTNDSLEVAEFSLPGEFDITKPVCTFDVADIKVLCPPYFENYIPILEKIAGLRDEYYTGLVGNLGAVIQHESKEPRIWEMIYIFIRFLITSFRRESVLSEPIGVLICSIIFDPQYSAFDPKEGFEIINTCRQFSIKLALQTDSHALKKIFNTMSPHPLLFAEVLERMILDIKLVRIILEKDKNVFSLIAQIANKVFKSTCDKTKIALVRFLNELFAETKMVKFAFLGQEFSTMFINLLLYESTNHFAYEVISKHITKTLSNEFITATDNYFTGLCASLTEGKNVERAKELLNMIMNDYAVLKNLSELVDRMLQVYCAGLSKSGIENQATTEEVNQYVVTLSKASEPSNELMLSFQNMLEKSDPDSASFQKLKKLIFDQSDDVKKIVKHPAIYKMLVSVFYPRITNEVIEYINSLCDYSELNSVAAHRGEIDVYLMERLLDEKEGKVPDEKLVDEILNLIFKIGTIVSSPVIVNRFVSLFCPHKGQKSKYYDKYLKYLSDFLEYNAETPLEALPLEPSFSVRTPDVYIPSEGFTFTTWIYLDLLSTSRLLEIINEEQKTIVSVQIQKRIIKWDDMEMFNEMPTKKWCFVAITYKSGVASCYVNGKSTKGSLVPYIDLANKKFAIRFGGSLTKCGHLGSHGLFNALKETQIHSLYQLGPRNNDTPSVAPIEYRNAKDIAELCSQTTKTIEQLSFAETLLRICKLDIVLPIFAQLGTSEGMIDQKRMVSVISIIRSAITSSDDKQAEFHNDNGFQVIAHLLLSSNYRGFTYDIYLQFYSIFQSVNDERLRADLLTEILLNFELWIDNEMLIFQQVTNHWLSTLFPIAGPLAVKAYPAAKLMNNLRIYCWFKPRELQQIKGNKERKVDEKLITHIRSNITSIICENYLEHLVFNDYKLLLSQCMSCGDSNQVYDLMQLLGKFTKGKNAARFFNSSEAIVGIQALVTNTDEFVAVTTLDLIVEIHRLHLIKSMSLVEHIEIVFQNITNCKLTPTLLSKLATVTQRNAPELFPICCYIAFVLGPEEHFRNLFDKLEPNPGFCTTPRWCMWPLVAAVTVGGDLLEYICQYLVLCSPKEWITIYGLTDHVCRCLGKNIDDTKAVLINAILDVALKNTNSIPEENQFTVFNIVSTFTLFRFDQIYNDTFAKLLEKEGFEVPRKEPVQRKMRNESFVEKWDYFIDNCFWVCTQKPDEEITEVTKKIVDTLIPSIGYCFGLRFKDGKWIDWEIAEKTLKFFSIVKIKQALDLCNLLCGFLNRSGHKQPEFVESFKGYSSQYRDFAVGIPTCIALPNFLFSFNVVNKPVEIIEGMKTFITNCLQKAGDLFNVKPYDLHEYSFSEIIEEKEAINEHNDLIEDIWKRKWSHMTIDHAPWDAGVENKQKHYKRAQVATSCYCPILLTPNRHFDQHLIASELRDTGAVTDTVTKREEELQKKKRSLRLNGNPLELVEEMKDEKKVSSVDPNEVLLSEVCELVTIKGEKPGTFELYEATIRIVLENKKYYHIDLVNIKEIMLRRKIQRETAIEIFIDNGESYFINFINVTGLSVVKRIKNVAPSLSGKCQLGSYKDYFEQKKLTGRWVRGEITNFEYLMNLNILAGRSFNDASQYPFLPWVVCCYDKDKLDLSDPSNYRDLTKPVGALGEERLRDLKARINDLKQFGVPPFLYSSYASSPLSLYLYLMRMEPFTTLHIDIQGGRFDNAARIFLSVASAYRSVTSQMNDYRELIPEFFFMPEFLKNIDEFDLGKTDGVKVNDVVLPKWAASPIDFVYKMRKSLESDHASKFINDWIDLMFGYKQRGEEAEKADNVFKHEMYDTVWLSEDQDNITALRVAEIEAIVNNVGQIPPQIFTEKHPKRILDKPSSILHKLIVNPLVMYPASFACVDEQERGKFVITVLAGNMLSKINVLIENVETVGDNSNVKFDTIPNPTVGVIPVDIHSCAQVSPNTYIAIGNSNYDAICFLSTTGATYIIPRTRHLISAISASDGWLAITGEDSRVHIYKKSNFKQEVANIPSYRNSILSCAISDKFKLIVSGTSDGALLLSSLHSYKTIRVVPLHDHMQPDKILILNSWGFIAVAESRVNEGLREFYLSVFNVNGMEIRHIELGFELSAWVSVSSKRGFDFILCASTDGKVYMFEAFYAKIGYPIIDAGEAVISLAYLPLSSIVVVVTKTKVLIAPYILEDGKIE